MRTWFNRCSKSPRTVLIRIGTLSLEHDAIWCLLSTYHASELLGKKTKGCFSSKAWFSAVTDFRALVSKIPTAHHRGLETDLTYDLQPSQPLPRRLQHPNKVPRVTYLSGVLEADLRATDPADAAPAAAPSIAPGSAEPDGFGVPKSPRHDRKGAGEWGQKGTSPQPMPNCRCVRCKHTVIKKAHWRLVHEP